MPLIVEDGSIVPDADSYVSLADARALAANYGLGLPADDTAAEVALRNGATYVGLAEPQMCGRRVSAEQSLAYPRTGTTLNGFTVADNVIPSQLIRAQVIAAITYGAGTETTATVAPQPLLPLRTTHYARYCVVVLTMASCLTCTGVKNGED